MDAISVSSRPAFIGHRDRCARKVKRDRADFVDRAGIDTVQFARRLDRRSFAGASEQIKAEQLFLGLGERAVEHEAIAGPRKVRAFRVVSSRAAGPSCPSFVR